jgi:hypothetical protein
MLLNLMILYVCYYSIDSLQTIGKQHKITSILQAGIFLVRREIQRDYKLS